MFGSGRSGLPRCLDIDIFSIFGNSKRWQRVKFCTLCMSIYKIGQVVKFLKPFPGEDPDQPYRVVNSKEGKEENRIDISPITPGLESPPVYTVRSAEMVLVTAG